MTDAWPLTGTRGQTMYRSLYQQLEELARTLDVSLFQLFIGVFYVYFTHTGQCDDWIAGLPVLSRANAP
jgi:hypothetical protein